MLNTVTNRFSSDRNNTIDTNSTILKSYTKTNSTILKPSTNTRNTRTSNTTPNYTPNTENPSHNQYHRNSPISTNLLFIIVFTFFIFCILIETYIALSQPNQPSKPIVIGVSPILQQTLTHDQVLKLQNKNNWLVANSYISFTTRRRKCIKEKCAPWIENQIPTQQPQLIIHNNNNKNINQSLQQHSNIISESKQTSNSQNITHTNSKINSISTQQNELNNQNINQQSSVQQIKYNHNSNNININNNNPPRITKDTINPPINNLINNNININKNDNKNQTHPMTPRRVAKDFDVLVPKINRNSSNNIIYNKSNTTTTSLNNKIDAIHHQYITNQTHPMTLRLVVDDFDVSVQKNNSNSSNNINGNKSHTTSTSLNNKLDTIDHQNINNQTHPMTLRRVTNDFDVLNPNCNININNNSKNNNNNCNSEFYNDNNQQNTLKKQNQFQFTQNNNISNSNTLNTKIIIPTTTSSNNKIITIDPCTQNNNNDTNNNNKSNSLKPKTLEQINNTPHPQINTKIRNKPPLIKNNNTITKGLNINEDEDDDLPDVAVLVGPDIKDARNQMKLIQFIYTNVSDANPENCAISLRINPNTGKYNTTSIYLCCNFIPWNMNGRRVIEVYNWYFEGFRWPYLRIEITHINANGIKYNKKALMHNDGITSAWDKYIQLQSKIISVTESIYKQAVYEYRENGRDEYLFKDVERNIIRVFANKLEKEVTPTHVLNLGIHKRFWREITPIGTAQNMRKLKIILDPQNYIQNHNNDNNEDDDVKMDEDQNGSDNVLDFSNWQHRYNGIYGVSDTFSGLKNSEIFPSTLVPNNKQRLPASSVSMGSDQQ